MKKYLGLAWLIATVTSWVSFGMASWAWAEDNFRNPGMLALTVLWFLISLVLFWAGLHLRKSS